MPVESTTTLPPRGTGRLGYAGFLTGSDLYVFSRIWFAVLFNSSVILWRRVCVSFDLWLCTAGPSTRVLFRFYLIGLDGFKIGDFVHGVFVR